MEDESHGEEKEEETVEIEDLSAQAIEATLARLRV
jgi:hypothetical protein